MYKVERTLGRNFEMVPQLGLRKIAKGVPSFKPGQRVSRNVNKQSCPQNWSSYCRTKIEMYFNHTLKLKNPSPTSQQEAVTSDTKKLNLIIFRALCFGNKT